MNNSASVVQPEPTGILAANRDLIDSNGCTMGLVKNEAVAATHPLLLIYANRTPNKPIEGRFDHPAITNSVPRNFFI